MKLKFLLSAYLLFCLAASAQTYSYSYNNNNNTNNCTTPVSNTFFQGEYNNINAAGNAYTRLTKALTLANGYCLSSQQVKQVTMLIYGDQDKLEFCKAAYRNTVDKDNFYDVYDAFAYFSTVFKLHDYVNSVRGNQWNNNGNNNNNNNNNSSYYTYPAYTYPEYNNYFGITGCAYPMDEQTFYTQYSGFAASKVAESAKVLSIKDFINVNCLSTSQIMKLTSIITSELSRLDILKAAYLRAYDRGNYGYADQLLLLTNNKLDFNNFVFGKPGNNTNTPNVVACTVSVTEMNDIKNTINNSSFDNTKITIGKQAISAKKCFTVAQIKELVGLYSFESSKLEMAKYSYDFCIDKSNYYLINDVFSFSSSKDDLSKYIAGR